MVRGLFCLLEGKMIKRKGIYDTCKAVQIETTLSEQDDKLRIYSDNTLDCPICSDRIIMVIQND